MFEGQHDGVEHPVLETVKFAVAHAERFGHLVLGGHAAQLGGETLLCPFELAGEVADRARRPVSGTNRIEDRSPDALSGEALERHATFFVVAAGRLHEAESTSPGQFVTIHVAREVHRHLEDDVLHERQIQLDHFSQIGLHRACTLRRTDTSSTRSSRSQPLVLIAHCHRPRSPSV